MNQPLGHMQNGQGQFGQMPTGQVQPSQFFPTKQSFLQILFSFKGRLPRKPFWLQGVLYSGLILMGIFLALVYIPEAAASDVLKIIAGLGIMLLVIASFWISIAIQIKRLHDLDRTAWWILISLIPVIGIVLLYFFCKRGTVGPNRFGEDTTGLY